MSKLTIRLAAATLTVLSAVSSAGYSLPQEGDPSKATLARLDARVARGELRPDEAAAVLFAEGAAVTEAVLLQIDQRRSRTSSKEDPLDGLLNQVPKVAVAVLALPDLSGGEHLRVAQVALEVLEHRGVRAGGLAQFAGVLEGVSDSEAARSLGKSAKDVVMSVASDDALQGDDLLMLMNAAGPALALEILQGAATGLAGDSLAFCLHRGSGFDGSILNQLQRSLQLGAHVKADQVASQVGPFLESELPFERSEAALILGRIGGREQVAPLIRRLKDPSKLVRTSTLAALRSLTGMTISGDPHRWSRWHADQKEWWQKEGRTLVASLKSTPRKRLVPALSAVAAKRLYRAEISEELVEMLERPTVSEVRLVISALGSLRDPRSVPGLMQLRNHRDISVRISAESALQSMRKVGRSQRSARRPSSLW